MRRARIAALLIVLVAAGTLDAQTRRRTPAKKAPAAAPPTRIQAEVTCPSELGLGVKTRRQFCDVLTGRDPKDGILIAIPPHRGPVTLSFELHNRHTYSEELIKAKRAFRHYTASVGVFEMDNTLVDRGVIISEFRTPADLVDRIQASPSGLKAVAPTGTETITITLPDTVGEQVSIVGENLKVKRPEGEDNFVAPGRPIATISNVRLEYRPGPAPKKRPSPRR
jgi:hypothetical protein